MPHALDDRRSGKAGGLLLLLIVAVVLIGLFVVPRAMRSGGEAVVLPSIDPATLEPALAERYAERMDAVRAAPDSADAWGELGIALDVHGRVPDAVTCYERALELNPDDHRWPYLLSIALEQGDPARAEQLLEQVVAAKPDHAAAHCRLGLLRLRRDVVDEADASFTRALELDPSIVAAHLGRARVELARGHPLVAKSHLDAAAQHDPRSKEIFALRAELTERTGDLAISQLFRERAGVDWQPEPVRDPWRDDLWRSEGVSMQWRRNRARAFAAAGNVEAMAAEWEAAAAANPESPEPLIELGNMYLELGMMPEAEERFEQAINRAPQRGGPRLALGNAYVSMKRIDDAIEAYRRALEVEPDLHEARSNLGAQLIVKGQTDEGFKLLNEACAALPNDANVHFNMGLAMLMSGDDTQGLESLETAIKIDPTHGRARFERGVLRARAKDYDGAIEDFEAVILSEPEQAAAYSNLARAYARKGDTLRMVETLRRGVEALPEVPQLAASLAWHLATSSDDAVRNGVEAVRLAQTLCQQTGYEQPQYLDILAAASAERGHFPPAVRYAEKAIRILSEGSPVRPGSGRAQRIEDMQTRLDLYRDEQPYRQESLAEG